MNAAGMLGYVPDSNHPEIARMGAFVTNPISLAQRKPAHAPQLLHFPGGFLLHTGYPNPGLRHALRRYSAHWARMVIPVVIHLFCDRMSDLSQMIATLEKAHVASAIEISLPYPISTDTLPIFMQAANSELPIILCVPLDRVISLFDAIQPLCASQTISAVSLGPPRGILPLGEKRLVQGRLYGPAIFPQALSVVQFLARQGIPVIGAGGVYSLDQAESMLSAGAIAVQFDTILWRGSIPDHA